MYYTLYTTHICIYPLYIPLIYIPSLLPPLSPPIVPLFPPCTCKRTLTRTHVCAEEYKVEPTGSKPPTPSRACVRMCTCVLCTCIYLSTTT